jgi:hypothetical protein
MLVITVLLVSFLCQLTTLKFWRNSHQLSQSKPRLFMGLVAWAASTYCLIWVYGTLAGIIVSIALVSLLGMLMPILVQDK